MALFFALSGYVYALPGKEIANKHDYSMLLKRKTKTLMIPYYIVGIITILIKIPFSGSIANGYSWINVILLPIKPVEQLWFLYVLFLCFCIKGFLEWKKLNGITIPILMLLLGTVISLYGGSTINDWGVLIINFLIYYIYFYAGNWVCENKKEINVNVFAFAIAAFVTMSAWIHIIEMNEIAVKFLRILLAFLGTIIVFFLSSKVKMISNCLWLSSIGRYSMIIYLIHPILCSVMRRGMYMVGIDNFAIHIILGTILGIILPMLFSILYKRLLNKG